MYQKNWSEMFRNICLNSFPHTQPFRTDCNPILKVKSLQPKLTASSLIFKGKRFVLLFSVGQGFIWWIWLLFTCTLLSGRFIFMATSSLMKMSGYFVLANSSSKTSNWDFVKVVRSLRCFRGGPVKKQKKINTAIEKLKFLGFASFTKPLNELLSLYHVYTATLIYSWNLCFKLLELRTSFHLNTVEMFHASINSIHLTQIESSKCSINCLGPRRIWNSTWTVRLSTNILELILIA